ncbi:MAG: hypothetical protein M3126_07740 [Candidatus Eremiobacteraeota bacterium]|nr:hypothetical protein [Candidatus Eremiobacteraeota bacterium]
MLAPIVCLLALAACGNRGSSAPIGIVDTQRMLQYWPAFQNDNNQLSVDMAAIERSHVSPAQKERARADLQGKYVRVQRDLTDQVRQAAEQVARDKNLKLIVTREFVGYGGTDITPDVEKVLKIVETSPSASR